MNPIKTTLVLGETSATEITHEPCTEVGNRGFGSTRAMKTDMKLEEFLPYAPDRWVARPSQQKSTTRLAT
jgi:hypothetical protein